MRNRRPSSSSGMLPVTFRLNAVVSDSTGAKLPARYGLPEAKTGSIVISDMTPYDGAIPKVPWDFAGTLIRQRHELDGIMPARRCPNGDAYAALTLTTTLPNAPRFRCSKACGAWSKE